MFLLPDRNLFRTLWLILSCLAALSSPAAADRLSAAVVEHLDNGLTVMVLEDPTLPLVSTQVLYKVGGRTESSGATGLAHFVEHMAFRATERFPDTDVVSRIYAVGGEWHGYTWIDQTTYFETVPREHLGLVLAIQADRMARLVIPAGEVEAERKAVLTELHGYENDPASVLHDAVAAVSFTEHPYRNNVIGWTRDVEQISHADIVDFYRRHYRPANAVLAIAGDVRATEVLDLVRRLFGGLPSAEPTPPPRTIEPPQLGERRVELRGAGARSRFEIAYRAPAATDPEFAAFLLLQAVLAGSTGANFRQDGDGVTVRPGSRLHEIGEDLETVFAPTAAPYLFEIAGTADPRDSPAEIEAQIEERIAALRESLISAEELERVRRDLAAELVLDVETTEDAAHQMAFYEGIGAFDVLRHLPERIAAVTAEELRRTALRRLQPWQRTIGWFFAGAPLMAPPPLQPAAPAPSPASSAETIEQTDREPIVKRLDNGIALIARRVPRIPAGLLRVVVPGNGDDPAWRHSSIEVRFQPGGLAQAAGEARRSLATAASEPAPPTSSIEDPEARLNATLRDLLGASAARVPPGAPTPVVIAAVGDLDETEAIRLLERTFRDLPARRPLPSPALRVAKRHEIVHLPGKAQAQIGYAVPAPPPSDPAADAWRILLYVMSHGYEGRLGKDLIARRGLLYSIDSRYQSDGRTAWISMTTGVNPENLDAARQRFTELMDALRTQTPTAAEIKEAKQHLLGRRLTAPMSNEEISAFYAQDWIDHGRLLSDEEEERRLRGVTPEDVLAVIDRFLGGASVIVDVAAARALMRSLQCY
ncbi:MAG TPA: insulinase family protein [Thermoanaerobaculia bacterium]|nr:insulinase family protein [Thermoanaerobaculia bacterium]